MPRVSSIEIHHFRGIPGSLTLDLRARKGAPPVSLLLFGDNGSGKSSIADALEFVLRASLLRRINPEQPTKRHAPSFAGDAKPYVAVSLDDGRTLARGAPGRGRYGPGVAKVEDPEPDFALAPLVLRRADILGFWSLPENQRKLVFFDYFRPATVKLNAQIQARKGAQQIEDEIQRLGTELTAAILALSKSTGIATRLIPAKVSKLKTWRQSVLVPAHRTQNKRGQWVMNPVVQRQWQDLYEVAVDLQRAQRTRRLNVQNSAGAQIETVEEQVQEILASAGDYVTESFLAVSRSSDFVDAVTLQATPKSNSLEITLELANGRAAEPTAVLSEANLDLLALLVFCAIAEASAEHGQAKLLVFDDVFQSVDATYRERACDYLARRFNDWQLVFCTHDRLWLAVMAETLRVNNVRFLSREIVSWSFEGGPVIREAGIDPDERLLRALADSDPVSICGAAGLLLEEISDRVSWTIGTSVTRRRGDRYTLGDLWPGVAKALKRTELNEAVEEAGASVVLRNLVGAHFNEWARGLSTSEARRFGDGVLALYRGLHCEDCGSWVQPDASGAGRWFCRCGRLKLQSGS